MYDPMNDMIPGYIIVNWLAILGHLSSALTMIFIYTQRDPLQIPYTETFLKWERFDNGTCRGRALETRNDGQFCIGATTDLIETCGANQDERCGLDLGWLIISFHLLSFVFQLSAALTDYFDCNKSFRGFEFVDSDWGPVETWGTSLGEGCCGYKYSKMIRRGTNPLRFIEYSISAAIMLMCIAFLNGVTDINLIASIAVLTCSCQLCGLAVEYVQNIMLKWFIHLNGWLTFLCAYGIIYHAFSKSATAVDGIRPPDFVYVIVLVLFLLYSSFGFVQLLELGCESRLCAPLCCKCCRDRPNDVCNRCNISCCPALRVPKEKGMRCNPLYKEMVFVTLSLGAKLVLGWLIFSNVLFN